MRNTKARETAWTGMLFALAIALSYLESLVSPLLGLMPAIKLGLSNVVVMYALLFLRTRTALLLVVLNLIDRHRFREYITKHPPGSLSNPPVFFRPQLFWHGQGSSWYRRMLYLVTEAPYEDDDDFEDDGDQPGPDGTGGAQENT